MKKPNLFFEEEKKKKLVQGEKLVKNIDQVKENNQRLKISMSSGKLQINESSQVEEKHFSPADMKVELLKLRNEKKNQESSNVSDNRVSTGINGLDSVMEGGFRRGTVNLVGGGPGTGKSIFCMQYLKEGIENRNENGIYISFEEKEPKVMNDFKRFGWSLDNKVAAKRLAILHYSPEQVEKVIMSGGGTVRDVIHNIKAKRIVIDSITAFTLLHETELQKRKAVLKLFEALESWGCTSLVISEQETDPTQHKANVAEFEVDGVILLYNLRKGDVRERALEIYKMRGTNHAAKIIPMNISDSGVVIYPNETVF